MRVRGPEGPGPAQRGPRRRRCPSGGSASAPRAEGLIEPGVLLAVSTSNDRHVVCKVVTFSPRSCVQVTAPPGRRWRARPATRGAEGSHACSRASPAPPARRPGSPAARPPSRRPRPRRGGAALSRPRPRPTDGAFSASENGRPAASRPCSAGRRVAWAAGAAAPNTAAP